MIVCLCMRGNVRSATCAQVLRDFFGVGDVVASGLQTTSDFTLSQFAYLNTVLIVGDDALVAQYQARCPSAEFTHLNIGDDRWMMPAHPDLVSVLIDALLAVGFKPTGFGAQKSVYMAAHSAAWARHHTMAAA